MQRQNYRNIQNNFVQGGTIQPGMNMNQPARQTRSNNLTQIPHTPMETQPAQVASAAPVTVKTEPLKAPTTAPTVKTEPLKAPTTAPVAEPVKMDEATSDLLKNMTEEDLLKLKKINFKKKVTGKEKRLRQNRKLFRMLTPRNAIAALNELHGDSIGQSIVVPTTGNQFEAEITINNVRYVGTGNSKMQAKNAASEKALRDLVINKFQQIKNQEPAPAAGDDSNMDVDSDKADDVPMLQLASFALHKLFAEWEAEGFEIPLPKSTPEPGTPALAASSSGDAAKPNLPKPPKIRTELPPNNVAMHPVMLLSQMRPCTQYADLGSQGMTPNIMHTVGATVDGQEFIGTGRSKKEARKRVATDILIKLFQWQGSCC